MAPTLSRSNNPIGRVRKLAGLTLAQASDDAGVHLQAFFLQERGVYPSVLPSILSWVKARFEIDADMVILDYHVFQQDTRVENGGLYGLRDVELGPPDRTPFVSFRKSLGLSRMGFAKKFCVHPGLLYRVEMGISRSLPVQLAEALEQSGLPLLVIDELRFRIEELT